MLPDLSNPQIQCFQDFRIKKCDSFAPISICIILINKVLSEMTKSSLVKNLYTSFRRRIRHCIHEHKHPNLNFSCRSNQVLKVAIRARILQNAETLMSGLLWAQFSQNSVNIRSNDKKAHFQTSISFLLFLKFQFFLSRLWFLFILLVIDRIVSMVSCQKRC